MAKPLFGIIYVPIVASIRRRHGGALSDTSRNSTAAQEVPFMQPSSFNPIAFALRRPITIMAGVAALAVACCLSLWRMPIDVFPALDLPVICVAQPYGGLSPSDVESQVVTYLEGHTLDVNGLHHVESRTVQGTSVIKLYFHPGTNVALATAETVAYVNRARVPQGTLPLAPSPILLSDPGGERASPQGTSRPGRQVRQEARTGCSPVERGPPVTGGISFAAPFCASRPGPASRRTSAIGSLSGLVRARLMKIDRTDE
jgi:hypothetical protein